MSAGRAISVPKLTPRVLRGGWATLLAALLLVSAAGSAAATPPVTQTISDRSDAPTLNGAVSDVLSAMVSRDADAQTTTFTVTLAPTKALHVDVFLDTTAAAGAADRVISFDRETQDNAVTAGLATIGSDPATPCQQIDAKPSSTAQIGLTVDPTSSEETISWTLANASLGDSGSFSWALFARTVAATPPDGWDYAPDATNPDAGAPDPGDRSCVLGTKAALLHGVRLDMTHAVAFPPQDSDTTQTVPVPPPPGVPAPPTRPAPTPPPPSRRTLPAALRGGPVKPLARLEYPDRHKRLVAGAGMLKIGYGCPARARSRCKGSIAVMLRGTRAKSTPRRLRKLTFNLVPGQDRLQTVPVSLPAIGKSARRDLRAEVRIDGAGAGSHRYGGVTIEEFAHCAVSRAEIAALSAPTGGGLYHSVAAGPHGAIWFTIDGLRSVFSGFTPTPESGAIARLVPEADGATTWDVFHETLGPGGMTPGSTPFSITPGPDGAMWFAEATNSCPHSTYPECGTPPSFYVGRISADGVVTEFSIGDWQEFPTSIVTGPDGNLWIATEYWAGLTSNADGLGPIIKMAPDGRVLGAYAVPNSATLSATIVPGPDGALYFNEGEGMGRIATDGHVDSFPGGPAFTLIDAADHGDFDATAIAAGADGGLWRFGATDGFGGPALTRATTAGVITLARSGFGPLGALPWAPEGEAAGTDGGMWTTWTTLVATRTSPTGLVNSYDLQPFVPGDPREAEMGQLAAAPDGNLYTAIATTGPHDDVTSDTVLVISPAHPSRVLECGGALSLVGAKTRRGRR